MSRLDDELMHLVSAPEPPSAGVSGPGQSSGAEAVNRKPRRNIKLLLVLFGLGLTGTGVVLMSFESAAVYSKRVDELLAERARLTGRTVRVEGTLVHGTLERREQPCEHRFEIAQGAARLGVDYAQCVLPDTFRDLSYAEVVVTAEGKLTESGRFEATRVMTRCPSKYEVRSRQPGEPPAGLPSVRPRGVVN
jgi:cytochrome c-type biogenesis protein CcmE